MEAERYVSLVPAFDTKAAGIEYHGLFTLIGPDWLDFPPDVIGMVPVQVEVPVWGWSYRIIEDAWRDYWTYVFGAPPFEEDFWRPRLAGGSTELYRIYEEWLESLLNEARVSVSNEFMMGVEMREQLYWSSLIPRKVVATSCDVCAPIGSWTLCSSMLMWHLDSGGYVKRWNPMLPSGAAKAQAELSHRGGSDEFVEACEEVWREHRETLADDDPEKEFETLYDLSDSDYFQTAMDLEGDIAEEMIGEVQREHVRLWNPPDWVLEQADDQLTKKIKWITKNYGHQSGHMFDIISAPLSLWQGAIDMEIKGRLKYG